MWSGPSWCENFENQLNLPNTFKESAQIKYLDGIVETEWLIWPGRNLF